MEKRGIVDKAWRLIKQLFPYSRFSSTKCGKQPRSLELAVPTEDKGVGNHGQWDTDDEISSLADAKGLSHQL